MAINPISAMSGPANAAPAAGVAPATSADAGQSSTTPPAAAADAVLSDLSANASLDQTDPLLADLSSQDPNNQDPGTLFAALTGSPVANSTDSTAQEESFFSSQLNVPVPAQQAVNAYLATPSGATSALGQGFQGNA